MTDVSGSGYGEVRANEMGFVEFFDLVGSHALEIFPNTIWRLPEEMISERILMNKIS